MSGTVRDARIPLSDGLFLAATLYVPDGVDARSPAPVLLEALPYRKDDLTAGYRPEYVRFRDEHGYVVCRVDLRGTGSSPGVALDEYPPQEQDDLVEAIAWLAGQDWCTGAVGMFGTSWSGFNSLQVAMRRPPALRAICASYATDDRWTDDVHWYGGSLRLLDQIDYPLYMLSMNALPPVPSLFGADWREEWDRRLDGTPPWQLRWLREQRRDPYWRHGSLRPDYGRITAATMLVVGWADGYRNNSLRTARALRDAGTPVTLLAGAWSHQAPATSVPGPCIDHVPLMARWFDRHLRDVPAAEGETDEDLTLFVRSYGSPAADAPTWNGRWVRETVTSLAARTVDTAYPLGSTADVVRVAHGPDVGLRAWNSCAGALPWGQPTDQREDDARVLCVDRAIDDPLVVLGNPRARLRVRAEVARAAVAVRLCSVAPDGTSLLLSRGMLNLSYRQGLTGDPPLVAAPVTPGTWYDVDVELEAVAYEFAPGERMRLAVGITEWPNAVAPPEPQGLSVDLGSSQLFLPVVHGPSPQPTPALPPPPSVTGAANDQDDGQHYVRWWTERDVLARRTSAHVDHGSSYAGERDSRCRELYTGTVSIDDPDWSQRVQAATEFEVSWPEVTVRTRSTLELLADSEAFDVTLTLEVDADGEPVRRRSWTERIPRDIG